jgi:cardiolipin synthase
MGAAAALTLAYLPNLITVGRLLLTPVTVMALVDGHFAIAFWLFMIAGVSDAVDGIVARQFNARTMLGAYLDPVADKVLLVSVYVTLGVADLLPHWLVILVVARDVAIVGGVLLLATIGAGPAVQPLMVSKVNTAMQILLAVVVLGQLGLDIADFGLTPVLCYIVGATTIASGVAYLVVWSRKAMALEEGEG